MSSRAYRPPPGRADSSAAAPHNSRPPSALPAPKPMGIAPSVAPPSSAAQSPRVAYGAQEESTGFVDLRKLAQSTGSSLQPKAFDPSMVAPPPLAPPPADLWASAGAQPQAQHAPPVQKRRGDRTMWIALGGVLSLALLLGGGTTAWLLKQRTRAISATMLAVPLPEPPVSHEAVRRSKIEPSAAQEASDDAAVDGAAAAAAAPKAPRRGVAKPRAGGGKKPAAASAKPKRDPCGCKGVLHCVLRCEAGR